MLLFDDYLCAASVLQLNVANSSYYYLPKEYHVAMVT